MNVIVQMHPLLFVVFIFMNFLIMGVGSLVLADMVFTDMKRNCPLKPSHILTMVGMLSSFFAAIILLAKVLVG